MSKEYEFELCDIIRETSFNIHKYLGSGYLENIYENALKYRLEKRGIQVDQQLPCAVYDEDDFKLGDFVIDLIVENLVLVELKAVSQLKDAHKAQLIGYLKAMKVKHGLLINFGGEKLEIRKFGYG